MYWHDIHVQVQVSSNIDGHGFCTHLEAMPIHAHLETIPTHAHPKPMGMGMGARYRALHYKHHPNGSPCYLDLKKGVQHS
jgi:hypothetical protein